MKIVVCAFVVATTLCIVAFCVYRCKEALVVPVQDPVREARCVCAFDIDHTLTCGNPKPLVDACKAKGCVLAINTARPTRYIADIPLAEYGFEYDPSDHYYQPESYARTAQGVAEAKARYLGVLRDKYRVPERACVILLDDAVWNLAAADAGGFGTVAASQGASQGGCGLSGESAEGLAGILRGC